MEKTRTQRFSFLVGANSHFRRRAISYAGKKGGEVYHHKLR
ncbi:MAG: hypothetical protein ACE5PV_16595 [Candidatus Poribacteria bacterium]